MNATTAKATRLSGPEGDAVTSAPAPLPSPRRRARASITEVEIARGAPLETLDRQAGEFLEAVPWEGPAPDPDVLDAVTFLAWL